MKARKVAEFALTSERISSKDVKHIGLKAAIANQILKKYVRNKNIKAVHHVMLTVPGQSVKVVETGLYIPCLKLTLDISHLPKFEKVNQIECDREFAFVTVTVPEMSLYEPTGFIGIDRNTTGHVAVAANPATGKVWKLGSSCQHIHKKYRDARRTLQEQGRYKEVKVIKQRESQIVRDQNHKIARKIIDIAVQNACGIKMEQLGGIRNNWKQAKSFRYSLHSWSFYQLQQFIGYKAKLNGVIVTYVDPAYTSQQCSRCGLIGDRNGKVFSCPSCGHVEYADANASFNIALRPPLVEGSGRFKPDRDGLKGRIDTPQEAPA
ncbi:MAG: transposase [Methanomassiliicoccales archaeon]